MINIKFKYKIKEIARKYNLPESVVEDIFKSQFKFYRETAKEMDLKDITTEEEFDNIKSTFYFKFIGKFHTKWISVNKLNETARAAKLKNGEEEG